MSFTNPVFISVIISLVVYMGVYKTNNKESTDFVGYDQSSLMYAMLAGAIVYSGLYFMKSTEPQSTFDVNTKRINGENVLVAPYSTT